MKYSNYIGVLAAIALIYFCFVPWVYIDTIKTTITGIRADNTNFGRPGVLHIFFSVVTIILFLLPKIWAKRTNLFFVTFNLSWSIRNFLLITQCEFGDCPEKKMGIYAIVFLSAVMQVMGMLPKMKVSTDIV
jgi:hypothetical protein